MSRALGDVDVAGLGSLAPLGYDYYAKLQGYADLAKAESGVGTNAPTATQSSGTIRYWNGVDYTSTTAASITAPITIPPLSITTNPSNPDLGTQVTLTGSIQPPSTATSSDTTPAGCSGTCTRTAALAASTGPSVSVTMTVVDLGLTVAELTFSVSTGTIQAKATYAPTPSS
jgi:hypothetical protein